VELKFIILSISVAEKNRSPFNQAQASVLSFLIEDDVQKYGIGNPENPYGKN
jgi:hypothetical protein